MILTINKTRKTSKDKAMKCWMLLILLIVFNSSSTIAQIGPIKNLTYISPFDHAVADFDNDGDLDIVGDGYDDPDRELVWFENADGQGSNWIPHAIDLPEGLQGSGQLMAKDVTGDGWPDILKGNSFALVHNGNAPDVSFTIISYNSVELETFIRTGDFDGDNDLDVLRWKSLSGAFTVYQNINQDGNFENPQILQLPPSVIDARLSDAQIIDMDQDNDLDIVATMGSLVTDSIYTIWYVWYND